MPKDFDRGSRMKLRDAGKSPDASPAARPTAIAVIERRGPSTSGSGAHVIHLTLELTGTQGRFADPGSVIQIGRAALALFPMGKIDAVFDEVPTKTGKVGSVEGQVGLAERPADALIASFRSTLGGAGYRTSFKEIRACGQAGCLANATLEWKPSSIPLGWHSSFICGKHPYRRCSACDSTYLMSSTNTPGPAPSLHCEVCGAILVEWGGTKVWQAELSIRACPRR